MSARPRAARSRSSTAATPRRTRDLPEPQPRRRARVRDDAPRGGGAQSRRGDPGVAPPAARRRGRRAAGARAAFERRRPDPAATGRAAACRSRRGARTRARRARRGHGRAAGACAGPLSARSRPRRPRRCPRRGCRALAGSDCVGRARDLRALPETHRAAVWFMCSEALANIARHAEASRAAIVVAHADDVLELEIGDDGRGGATLTRGLRGLADRVDALGGVLALNSPPGGPTVLRVRLPIKPPSSALGATLGAGRPAAPCT